MTPMKEHMRRRLRRRGRGGAKGDFDGDDVGGGGSSNHSAVNPLSAKKAMRAGRRESARLIIGGSEG